MYLYIQTLAKHIPTYRRLTAPEGLRKGWFNLNPKDSYRFIPRRDNSKCNIIKIQGPNNLRLFIHINYSSLLYDIVYIRKNNI